MSGPPDGVVVTGARAVDGPADRVGEESGKASTLLDFVVVITTASIVVTTALIPAPLPVGEVNADVVSDRCATLPNRVPSELGEALVGDGGGAHRDSRSAAMVKISCALPLSKRFVLRSVTRRTVSYAMAYGLSNVMAIVMSRAYIDTERMSRVPDPACDPGRTLKRDTGERGEAMIDGRKSIAEMSELVGPFYDTEGVVAVLGCSR